jgi:hypothetical protein
MVRTAATALEANETESVSTCSDVKPEEFLPVLDDV